MTVPYVPGPGGWPPAVPPQPPRRRLPLGRLIALVVLGVVVLCVGGTAAIGAIVVGASPSPTAGGRHQFVDPVATTPGPTSAIVPAEQPTPTTAAPRKAVPAVAPATTKARPKPATHKPTPSPTAAAPRKGVHPGAFCSPKGALGYTSTGKLMQCKPSATDTRNRWRAA
jgi:hypothetical protein